MNSKLEFSDEDFTVLNKGYHLAEMEPGTVSVQRSSMAITRDIAEQFGTKTNTDNLQKALVRIAYSAEKKAIRLSKGITAGNDFIFTQYTNGLQFRMTSLPTALKAAKIEPGIYKRVDGHPDIYVLTAPYLYNTAGNGRKGNNNG